MVQHDKSTEDLQEAIDSVKATCEQYLASVREALTIAGYSYSLRDGRKKEIEEYREMIIKMCEDRK